MNFESDQIDHGEQLREQSADVIKMRENALGAFVSFTAENVVAADTEPVKKILFLGRSFLHETRKPSFDRLQFPGMHFKIRMETDEIRLHNRNVRRARWRGKDGQVLFEAFATLTRREQLLLATPSIGGSHATLRVATAQAAEASIRDFKSSSLDARS